MDKPVSLDEARLLTSPGQPPSDRRRAWARLSRGGFLPFLVGLVGSRDRGSLEDLLERARSAGEGGLVGHDHGQAGRQAWLRWQGTLQAALALLSPAPAPLVEEACLLVGGSPGSPADLRRSEAPEVADWISRLENVGWALGPLRDLLEGLAAAPTRKRLGRGSVRVLGTGPQGAFCATLEVEALPDGSGLLYPSLDVLLVPREAAFEEALLNGLQASGRGGSGAGLDACARTRQDLRWNLRGKGLVRLEGASVGLPAALAFSGLGGELSWPEQLAATGAITPRGQVRRVGALEEKLELASRQGLFPVCYPAEQQPELERKGLDGPGRLAVGELSELLERLRLEGERPWMLPPRPVLFVGRAEEVDALRRRLLPASIVGLAGPGGVGKTTLAAWTLHRMSSDGTLHRRFPGGVITCDFYRNPRVADAIRHILAALGSPAMPTPVDALRQVLARVPVLLVLDGAELADDLQALLSASGSAGVLVTTREEEQLDGAPLRVEPLPREDSLKLLRRRAGAAGLGEAQGRRLCELVGDLPLAVHLAARYLATGAEAPSRYLQRLETDLLPALHRGTHRRESVPVLLEQSLAKASLSARTALGAVGLLGFAPFPAAWMPAFREALAELRRLGLLVRHHGRYGSSHRLVHEHARTREALPREEIRRLVRRVAGWGDRTGADLDLCTPHVSALLDRLHALGAWRLVRRLAETFDDRFYRRGNWAAWRDLQVALQRDAERRGDEEALLRARGNAAIALENLGDTREAAAQYEAVLRRACELGDPWLEGSALRHLGLLKAEQGLQVEALSDLEASLDLFERLGSSDQQMYSKKALAQVHMDHGRQEQALEHLNTALALDPGEESRGALLAEIGWATVSLGRLDEAEAAARQALELARRLDRRMGEAPALSLLAAVNVQRGRPGEAIPLLERCLELEEEMGHLEGRAGTLGNLAGAHLDAGDAGRARELARESISLHRKLGHPAGEANDLAVLGEAGAHLGFPDQALACCLVAVATLEALGENRALEARARLERVRALTSPLELAPESLQDLVEAALR